MEVRVRHGRVKDERFAHSTVHRKSLIALLAMSISSTQPPAPRSQHQPDSPASRPVPKPSLLLVIGSVVTVVAVVAVVLGLVPILISNTADDGANSSCSSTYDSAPLFDAMDVDSKHWRLDYFLGEKPILIHFFSSDCVWCDKMTEEMKVLKDHYGDDVEFVSISIYPGDTPETVREFRNRHNATWAHIYTEEPLAEKYCLTATPILFVVDTEGIIRETIRGYHDADFVKQKIDPYL